MGSRRGQSQRGICGRVQDLPYRSTFCGIFLRNYKFLFVVPGRGSGGVKSAGVSRSVRETGRDESQSAASPEKPFKTRDLELLIFEGSVTSCSLRSAGYTRTSVHPYFSVTNCCRWETKGWFSKRMVLEDVLGERKPERGCIRGCIRMLPRNENRNEGTFACSPRNENRNEGAFAKTTFLRNRPF